MILMEVPVRVFCTLKSFRDQGRGLGDKIARGETEEGGEEDSDDRATGGDSMGQNQNCEERESNDHDFETTKPVAHLAWSHAAEIPRGSGQRIRFQI